MKRKGTVPLETERLILRRLRRGRRSKMAGGKDIAMTGYIESMRKYIGHERAMVFAEKK